MIRPARLYFDPGYRMAAAWVPPRRSLDGISGASIIMPVWWRPFARIHRRVPRGLLGYGRSVPNHTDPSQEKAQVADGRDQIRMGTVDTQDWLEQMESGL